MSKLNQKIYAITQRRTQAGNFINNHNYKINFCLSEFSATKILTCECHVDDSEEGRYDIILVRYIVIVLRLY